MVAGVVMVREGEEMDIRPLTEIMEEKLKEKIEVKQQLKWH